jgi:hypothetical protein
MVGQGHQVSYSADRRLAHGLGVAAVVAAAAGMSVLSVKEQ